MISRLKLPSVVRLALDLAVFRKTSKQVLCQFKASNPTIGKTMVPEDCESSSSYEEWQDERLIALSVIAVLMLVVIGAAVYMVFLFM